MPIKILLSLLFFICASALPAMGASVSLIPASQTFERTPTHVWDGDGPIWCEEGPRVRLNGINARELDEPSCKEKYPCTDASGESARDALFGFVWSPTGETSSHGHVLVKGPKMICLSIGKAGGKRTAALCVSPKGGDLSCSMVNGGWIALDSHGYVYTVEVIQTGPYVYDYEVTLSEPVIHDGPQAA